jgi:DNA-binding NarL/FixJ family response regulator
VSGNKIDVGRVLVVDDEPRVLDGLRLALRPDGHQVDSSTSTAEAAQLMLQQDYDVIIADEHLPDESGSEFLAWAYTKDPFGVRIVLSGRPTVSAAIRAVNGGRVFRILCKPVSGAELRSMVKEALAESRRLRAQERNVRKASEPRSAGRRLSLDPSSLAVMLAPGDLCPLGWEELTLREREVLASVVNGWRVSQIAPKLFISVHTVRNHLKSIYRKLDIHSQRELIERARTKVVAAPSL